ncbi:hypothetical protein GGF37_001650 [Kickxella alabastrina]|nr:hypothetical protein GGF37_001650 [Kickxella alabastrina]
MQLPEHEPALRKYLEEENKYARQVMRGTARLQRQIAKELRQATEVDQVPPPIETRSGDFIYYTRQSDSGCVVYCRRPVQNASAAVSGDCKEQVLMDSEKLAKKFGYELRNLLVSDDHKTVACLATKHDGGHSSNSESSSLLIFSLGGNGEISLLEVLEDIFNFVFGLKDTLFYTVLDSKLRAHKVLGHRIGCPQSEDVSVYAESNDECFVDITRTKDKKFHIVNSSTLDSSELQIFPSSHDFWQMRGTGKSGNSPLHLIRPRQRGIEYFVDHHDGEFIVLTNSPTDDNSKAPVLQPLPFRLVRSPTARPSSQNWTELFNVADNERIDDVEIFQKYIVVSIKRQGRPAVLVYNRILDSRSELSLPYDGNCTVRPTPSPQFDASTVRLCFSSPVHLDSVVEYNMSTLAKCNSWTTTPLHMIPSEYMVRRVTVSSSGGQDVPMTLIHHESALLSQKSSPALIRVYGAYGVPLEPEFRLEDIPLLRRGWTIALAHVRGGGELGREWYSSGRGQNKVNSVNDLIACAQYLLDKGWSSENQLAITGVSAGGLVIGAALNAQPTYFRAAALHVPFVDPLSAMLSPDLPLTSVETTEWGNPLTTMADYTCIAQYAPYDNIKNIVVGNKRSPSILVTAGGQDQRVSAWQPAKWVARLRSRGGYSEPVSRSDCSASKLIFSAAMGAGHFHSARDNGDQGEHNDDGSYINTHALRNAFLISETSN